MERFTRSVGLNSWRVALLGVVALVGAAACGSTNDQKVDAGDAPADTAAPTDDATTGTTVHDMEDMDHDMEDMDHGDHDSTGEEETTARPFDPAQPVDLSGYPGVSAEQQARAEDLLQRSLDALPHWADPATAVAEGYASIGDGLTGFEHFLKWASINDETYLDPTAPESLVYRVEGGQKTLSAAMFILPDSFTLENVPDVGGPLTQFHIHNNLCFSDFPEPRVIGLRAPNGTCSVGQAFNPNVMMHVWITAHPCGPFAALEGVGAGQILEGEERACDHVHGSGTF